MRKEITMVVEAEGRDQGKAFHIREMSAMQAESWAGRFLLALAKAGHDVPPDLLQAGMEGIAVFGIRALSGMEWDVAKSLLDEMLLCVQTIPDPSKPAFKRALIEDDIEEITTILKLRDEVLRLHTGFSIADAFSKSAASAGN